MLIGLVLAGLYFAQARRIYQSKAQILVVKKRLETQLTNESRSNVIEDYVSTHQALIKSPIIIEAAIKTDNLRSLSCFADLDEEREDLTDFIIRNLNVSRNRSSAAGTNNILDISFDSIDPDERPLVPEQYRRVVERNAQRRDN